MEKLEHLAAGRGKILGPAKEETVGAEHVVDCRFSRLSPIEYDLAVHLPRRVECARCQRIGHLFREASSRVDYEKNSLRTCDARERAGMHFCREARVRTSCLQTPRVQADLEVARQ